MQCFCTQGDVFALQVDHQPGQAAPLDKMPPSDVECGMRAACRLGIQCQGLSLAVVRPTICSSSYSLLKRYQDHYQFDHRTG